MATNVVSNVNPADIAGSGLDIPSGTLRHDVILSILSEVVNINSTSFGRITSADPTPTGIQYLADTGITSGGTSYISTEADMTSYYAGVYFKDDYELVSNAGTTAAVVMFYPFRYSLGASVIDPVKHSSPGVNSKLNGCISELNRFTTPVDTDTLYLVMEYPHNDSSISHPGNTVFQFQNQDDYYAGMSSDATELPFKVYVFTADEFIAWRVVSTTYDRLAGIFMAWRWDPPGDGHFSRTDLPFVSCRSFDPLDENTEKERPFYDPYRFGQGCSIPEPGTVGGKSFLDTGPGFGRYALNAAPDNTDIVQDEIALYDGSFAAFPGTVPGLKVMRPGSVSLWDTMTINTTDYICFHKEPKAAYFIQYQ